MTDPTPDRPGRGGDDDETAGPSGTEDTAPTEGAEPAGDGPADADHDVVAPTDDAPPADDDGEGADGGEPRHGDAEDRPDESDEGPIRPEVVRQREGGGGFFARMAAAQASANVARAAGAAATPKTRRPLGTMVRAGCAVLILLGIFSAIRGAAFVADPSGVVCNNAKAIIIDEEDDEDDFDEDAVLDLECAEAIERANALDDTALPTESTARTTGIVFFVFGVLQVAIGALLRRRHERRLRIAALALTALGLLTQSGPPIQGGPLIGLAMTLFVAYAIGFSADSRAVFGLGRGFGSRRTGETPPEPPPEPAA